MNYEDCIGRMFRLFIELIQLTLILSLCKMKGLGIGVLWLGFIPCIVAVLITLRDYPLGWFIIDSILFLAVYKTIQRIIGRVRIGNLHKRAVFITGCDTGFGNLLALKCLRHGMPVFAGCLTEKGASDLRESSQRLPGILYTIIVDVSKDESVQNAAAYLDEATEQYGGLHGVVNNAGIVGSSFYDDLLTTEDYKKVAEVNTFGVIRVTQSMKHLLKKTRGRIVNISSICSRLGIVGLGPYTVSKYAIAGYSEIIRQELRHFGVSVHILEPGFFKTPLIAQENVQSRLDEMWKGVSDSIKEEYGEEFFNQGRKKAIDMLDMVGSDSLDLVVNAYFHALTSRKQLFPQHRYQVGLDAQFIFTPMSYLPTGCRDAFSAFVEMILGAPVPKAAIQKYSKRITTFSEQNNNIEWPEPKDPN